MRLLPAPARRKHPPPPMTFIVALKTVAWTWGVNSRPDRSAPTAAASSFIRSESREGRSSLAATANRHARDADRVAPRNLKRRPVKGLRPQFRMPLQNPSRGLARGPPVFVAVTEIRSGRIRPPASTASKRIEPGIRQPLFPGQVRLTDHVHAAVGVAGIHPLSDQVSRHAAASVSGAPGPSSGASQNQNANGAYIMSGFRNPLLSSEKEMGWIRPASAGRMSAASR